MTDRIAKLLGEVSKDASFEAALITSDQNRFYFFGMRSSAGTAVVLKDKAYFIIDSRYHELALRTVKNAEVILQGKLYEQINEILAKHNVKTVWVEQGMSLGTFNGLKKQIKAQLLSENPLTSIISKLRMIKDEDEVKLIRRAQELTDMGFSYIITQLRPGVTEREMQLELENYMKKNGADGLSFDTILISGKNTSLPHGVPTHKVIEKGDFVTMDYAAAYGGYCSDMTRTVAIGEPTEEMRHVYNIVLEAQLKSMAAIKRGVVCSDIDKIARDHIYSNGYEGCFGHSLGHCFGIDIHEPPFFSPNDNSILPRGAMITIEPGIYLPERFGVRIEDTVRVTEDGYIPLTYSTKELLVL